MERLARAPRGSKGITLSAPQLHSVHVWEAEATSAGKPDGRRVTQHQNTPRPLTVSSAVAGFGEPVLSGPRDQQWCEVHFGQSV